MDWKVSIESLAMRFQTYVIDNEISFLKKSRILFKFVPNSWYVTDVICQQSSKHTTHIFEKRTHFSGKQHFHVLKKEFLLFRNTIATGCSNAFFGLEVIILKIQNTFDWTQAHTKMDEEKEKNL